MKLPPATVAPKPAMLGTALPLPRFLDAGETALVVEFGSTIDDAISERVLALDAALSDELPAGVVELVPTYRSLMIHYDPLVVQRSALVAAVHRALDRAAGSGKPRSVWHLPACYDPAFADDLSHIAASTGLRAGDVITRHASARYRVAMYGFSPGWAYLSGLPQDLALPRRASPRDRIAAGSLIIAGGQAIVAGLAMPSGWHILGRTPERLFAPERRPVFLVSVGDAITFDPVDRPAFAGLEARALAGEIIARREAIP